MAILRKGDVGPEVKALQEKLIKLGYNCGPDGADGDFGNLTFLALIKFQKAVNIEADGEAGPQTMAKLNNALKNGHQAPKPQIGGYTATNLIAIASAEIGYKEKNSNSNLDSKTANAGGSNFTKYARDLAALGYYNGSKQGYAWCDVFVDWCFLQLCGGDPAVAQELQCQTGPYGAGCSFSAQYYQQQGRWSNSPSVGAQIFFNVNGSINHTGIVSGINGNNITTIEGNSSDQVVTRTYNISNKSIAGYGLPKYKEQQVTPPVVPEVVKQNTFTPYKVKITAKKLNIRKKPDKWAEIIGIAKQGEIKEIVAEENSFGKLGNEDGWIMLAYTRL